jgi:hypothetical protein
VLKFIFWLLLAVNGALYAYGQGYLGHFSGNEREPARLKNQLNASQLSLMPATKAEAAVSALKPDAALPAEKKTETIACVEIGNFVLADARRFEALVAPLELGDRQSRHNLPGTEISSYIVYVPSQGNKEGADKKVAELRGLGVTNYFIMSDNPTMRWGISLGVFKSEAAAQSQLATLQKQGVHSARVAPRYSGSKLLAYQFRDITGAIKAELEDRLKGFSEQEVRSCK